MLFDGTDYVRRYLFCIKLHGEVTAFDKRCTYKAWAYVGQMNVVQLPDMFQLAEALQVVAGEPLRSRVGWGSSQSLGTSN